MTFSFTPGPWSVFAQPISGRADAILELIEQVQATEPVADHIYLINADGKCPAVAGCGPTSEANARLIAAAPALAEALRAILVDCGEAGSDGYVENSIHIDEVNAARAALSLLNPEPTPAVEVVL